MHNMHNMQEYDVDHMIDKNNMDDDDGGDDMGDHYIMKNGEVREQDRYLPIANIARIMKTVLPGNAKIAKDAKESIQECVSEFISFITSEASDKCQQEKRKTINGDDLLWAMSTLGFDKYIEPLKLYLAKYRESVKGEKPEKKPSSSSKKNNNESNNMPSHQAQPKGSSHHHNSSMMGGSSSGGMSSVGTMGMMLPGSSGLKGAGILPSMSDLSSYNPYDSSAGSLLMGNLEDSPLFLAPGSGPNSHSGGGGVGGLLGDNGGGILPPLPKKRKEHPPSDMQFPSVTTGVSSSAGNPHKHI
jgi:nuclear transcription Y subunit beta